MPYLENKPNNIVIARMHVCTEKQKGVHTAAANGPQFILQESQ